MLDPIQKVRTVEQFSSSYSSATGKQGHHAFDTLFSAAWLTRTYLDNSFSSSLATASPTCCVLAVPPMSPVLTPLSIVILTASSIILASAGRFNEYWSIIAVESIAATGLTTPLPDMSGAEPVIVHE